MPKRKADEDVSHANAHPKFVPPRSKAKAKPPLSFVTKTSSSKGPTAAPKPSSAPGTSKPVPHQPRKPPPTWLLPVHSSTVPPPRWRSEKDLQIEERTEHLENEVHKGAGLNGCKDQQTSWFGSGPGLTGPVQWSCPRTDQTVSFLAGRVGATPGSPVSDCEPLVVYFAGLGDAGEPNPREIHKKFQRLQCHGRVPFLFLAPLRQKGYWWVLEGDGGYGWLGELRYEKVVLFADFLQHCLTSLDEPGKATRRPVIGLGFSAGAYCLTEVLALGRPCFTVCALGGLHGHGQNDVEELPERRRPGVVEKYHAYLERISNHPGVPGGIIVTHAEADQWSPCSMAWPCFHALGVCNETKGCGPVKLCILLTPCGKKGHEYEGCALWQQELFEELLRRAASPRSRPRRRPAPRGSLATELSGLQPAASFGEEDAVHVDVGKHSLNDLDAALGLMENASSDCESDRDCWEESVDDVSECEDASTALGFAELAEMSVLGQDEDAEELLQAVKHDLGEWQFGSSLDMDMFSVYAEAPDAGDSLSSSISPFWAVHAADIFREHGFVVVHNALTERKAAKVLEDCRRVAAQMVRADNPKGNRPGGARYSMTNAASTGSLLHLESFARCLLDNWVVLSVVRAISRLELEGDVSTKRRRGSVFRCVRAGGDFVLPGERQFQPLHSDLTIARRANVHLPPPLISANFCVHDIDGENGQPRSVVSRIHSFVFFFAFLLRSVWCYNP
mmetsp:Transcript_117873/g.229181  ORF Transcript_117873/g.229181 Transcript_117873/m.229181 type:complete len:732 (+) Transcript_117873:72-2267(+)